MSFEQRAMGWGRLAVLAMGLSLLATSGEASAFTGTRTSRAGRELAAGGHTRTQRDVAWQAPERSLRAHAALAARLGAREAMWDRDTGVLLRAWGSGVAAPGSVQSAEVAARGARELLAQHLALLAPGSRLQDFELVGNHLGDGIRSVGFAQRFAGRPVLGGQLSFRFKHDRLVAIGSEALPDVRAELADQPIGAAAAQARARAWILADAAASATAGAVEGPFILPIVASGKRPVYREVMRVTVDAAGPIGRFAVYLDSATGEPVAREQLLHFASGVIQYQVPLRGPQGARVDLAATLMSLFVNGVAGTTDVVGGVNFADGGNAAVIASVQGPQVRVVNENGPGTTKDLSLPPGGAALWADPGEVVEAQTSAFIHASVVKQRIRSIDPTFEYLNQQLLVTVNINDICNAFSDGDSLNFFSSGEGCENTARIADVVYHEFGHSAHAQGLIPGVGQFEGALSEGIADYLSSTITNDASLAPGFFLDSPNEPLRELDPVGDEWSWPDDLTGEVHDDGRIIGGTLWDLRTALIAKLGPAAGVAQADKIFFGAVRRAVDIPTMYPEALLVDDDDGDLANGTPNECEINLAFAAHGLLGGGGVTGSVSLLPPTPNGTPVRLNLAGGTKACVDLAAVAAELRVREAGNGAIVTLPMSPEPGGFLGVLPAFPDGTLVEYQVRVVFNDDSIAEFPQNPADPFYEIYFGPVTPLFCSSLETPPANEGWKLDGAWQWGTPLGQAGDPGAAFSGANVLAQNLAGPYAPDSQSTLLSPPIPTLGFPTVRLQYRRWLNVEDAFFDQAQIRVNGLIAWENLNSMMGDFSNVHHRDSEWRFHDVDITDLVSNDQVTLEFNLLSDGGVEMGGWTIDEVCVVGTDEIPAGGVCGDGVLGPAETCDAGPANSDTTPGACRTNCLPARCGDLVVDPGEQCDDGNLGAGDGCDPGCLFEPAPPTTTAATSDVPTESFGDDSGDESSGSSGSESNSGAPLEGDLADRGCACDAREPAGLPTLGLGLLALLGLRRRRR